MTRTTVETLGTWRTFWLWLWRDVFPSKEGKLEICHGAGVSLLMARPGLADRPLYDLLPRSHIFSPPPPPHWLILFMNAYTCLGILHSLIVFNRCCGFALECGEVIEATWSLELRSKTGLGRLATSTSLSFPAGLASARDHHTPLPRVLFIVPR